MTFASSGCLNENRTSTEDEWGIPLLVTQGIRLPSCLLGQVALTNSGCNWNELGLHSLCPFRWRNDVYMLILKGLDVELFVQWEDPGLYTVLAFWAGEEHLSAGQ